MNEEILQNIWNQLTQDGMTTSDFETWKSNFAGSEDIQKNVHGYLLENNLTDSDIDTWSSNVGLKKKTNPTYLFWKRIWYSVRTRKNKMVPWLVQK